MRNRWKTFKPRIEVYWYDSASSDAMKEKKRATLDYREIKEGIAQRYTIVGFDSTFFDPTNDAETVELRLYDRGTGLLMDTITEIVI